MNNIFSTVKKIFGKSAPAQQEDLLWEISPAVHSRATGSHCYWGFPYEDVVGEYGNIIAIPPEGAVVRVWVRAQILRPEVCLDTSFQANFDLDEVEIVPLEGRGPRWRLVRLKGEDWLPSP